MIADWSIQKTAFLFFVMAIITILSFRKSTYGLYFLLLMVFLRPQDDRPILALLHIPLIFTLMAFFAAIKDQKLTMARLSRTNLFKLLIIFVAIIHISAFFAYNPVAAWQGVGEYYFIIFFFIIILTVLETENDFDFFAYAMLICGLYFAYLLQFRGSNMLESISGEHFARKNFAKLNFNFGNPNYLAIIMVIINTFAFSLFLRSKKVMLKLLFISMCIVFIYTIIQTQSRGGTISLLSSFLLFGMFYERGKKILVSIGIILIIGLPAIEATFPNYLDRMKTISSYQEDESATDRIALWKNGIGFIFDNPLVGIGPSNFEEMTFNTPHNSYIQMASELGIPGLIVWLLLFGTGISSCKKAYILFKKNQCKYRSFYFHGLAIRISLIVCAISSVTTGLGHREFLYMLIAMGGAIFSTAQHLQLHSEKHTSLNNHKLA